jgi:hypothetical protein
VGFVVDKVAGTGEDFSKYFGFPLPVLIPPTAPHSLTIPSFMLHNLDADKCFYITN